MVGKVTTSQSPHLRKGVSPPKPSEPVSHGVPLKFWAGHKVLWTVTLPMEVQNLIVDPFGEDSPASPNLAELASDLSGVYRPSEPLPSAAPMLDIAGTRIRYIESTFQRRFIDMRTSFDDYMSQFSGKTRSTIKRKVRKFEAESGGEIKWSVYRSPKEIQHFHSLAREISKLTYQEKLFDSGLPDDAKFVAEMHADARADAVRGFILFFADKPISYLYLPIRDQRVMYGHLGFDPSFSKHSPGTVLQLLALEHLFAENRYEFFDFTEGEGAHKKTFATHERFCGNVYYLRRTLKNLTLVRLHLITKRLSQCADRALDKSGIKAHLKRVLRGRADQR